MRNLRQMFLDAGWEVTDVPARIKIEQHAGGINYDEYGFPICILGRSNHVFYSISWKARTYHLPDDSINDEPVNGNGDQCGGDPDECLVCCTPDGNVGYFTSCGCGNFFGQTNNAYGEWEADDNVFQNIASKIGAGLKWLFWVQDTIFIAGGEDTHNYLTDISGGRIWHTAYYIAMDVNECDGPNAVGGCVPDVAYGNQLMVRSSSIMGQGILVRSKDSIAEGNNLQLYITYDNGDTSLSRFRIYYHKDGFPDFNYFVDWENPQQTGILCDPTYQEFPTFQGLHTGTHPMRHLEDAKHLYNDYDEKVLEIQFTNRDDTLDVFVNSFSFIYNTVSTTGNYYTGFMGALKPKALRGSTKEGDSNYTDALSMRKSIVVNHVNNQQGFKIGGWLQGGTCGWVFDGDGGKFADNLGSADGSPSPPAITSDWWGFLTLAMIGSSNNVNNWGNPLNGLLWLGNVAEIAEPWVACNFVAKAGYAPIVAQIWDACVPHVNLNYGYGNIYQTPMFVFDDWMWRHYRTSGFGESNQFRGPASALALRVKDPRIFLGVGPDCKPEYLGPQLGEITDVVISPIEIINGMGASIDIYMAEDKHQCVMIYELDSHRCTGLPCILEFTGTHIVTGFNSIGLAFEEEATIVVKSINRVTRKFKFLG
jgi:hypothetical protein